MKTLRIWVEGMGWIALASIALMAGALLIGPSAQTKAAMTRHALNCQEALQVTLQQEACTAPTGVSWLETVCAGREGK